MIRRSITALVLLALAGWHGAFAQDVRLPREPDGTLPYLDHSSAWPARYGVGGVIIDEPGATSWQEGFVWGRDRKIEGDLLERALRLCPPPPSHSPPGFGEGDTPSFFMEDRRAFIVVAEPPGAGVDPDPLPPSMIFTHMTGQTEEVVDLRRSGTNDEGRPVYEMVTETGVVVQRTLFAMFEAEGRARGVALLMPGMFATPEDVIESLIGRLRREGWAVLYMVGHPSRVTESVVFRVDLSTDETRAESASRIASVLDGYSAEYAYAARAAFAHLIERRPELAALPRVGIGMSGGGMALSTVAALEPESYDALVYIGAGAHNLRVGELSNYADMIDAFRVVYSPEEPDDDARYAFHRLYLDHTRLDPYHTAGALLGTPALMIQATGDLAVPSHLGDVLWRRLGRPERWEVPGGHELLFMLLGRRFDDIVEWLEVNTMHGADDAD
jgi:hypothetical protein